MTKRKRAAFLCALLGLGLLAGAPGATAQEFLGRVGDWNMVGYVENDQRYCYIHSEPVEESGNYSRRGKPYVLVVREPGGAEEVTVTSGYPYKEGTEVEVAISGAHFGLFVRGEKAWAKTAEDDKALIAAMRAGARMTVRGVSRKGTYSLDTYSLKGVTRALQEIHASCTR